MLEAKNLERLIDMVLFETKRIEKDYTNAQRKSLSRRFYIQIAQILILSLMAFAMVYWITQHFLSPLVNLSTTIKSLKDGKLGVQSHIDSNDEVGALVRVFNEMSSKLEETHISRQYLEKIINTIDEFLVVTDTNGNIELFNSSFYNVMRNNSYDLFSANIRDFLTDYTNSGLKTYKSQLITASEEKIPVSISVTGFHTASGTPMTILVLRDERENLLIRKNTENLRAKLAHSQQLASLGSLSGEVAHRLNQPLTSLRLFLQQIARTVNNSENADLNLSRAVDNCLKEIERASQSVKGILQITRKEQTAKEIKKFGRILAEVERVIVSENDLQSIVVNKDGDPDIKIFCSPDEIRELLFILIKNAIDASVEKEKKHINIDWMPENGFLEIKITDFGSGIKEDDLPYIFDNFYSTKPIGQGTGLGLNIAQKIIREHGGKIEVTSKVGQSTTFRILLPLQNFSHRSVYEQEA